MKCKTACTVGTGAPLPPQLIWAFKSFAAQDFSLFPAERTASRDSWVEPLNCGACMPAPAAGAKAQAILENLARLSQPFGTKVAVTSTEARIDLK